MTLSDAGRAGEAAPPGHHINESPTTTREALASAVMLALRTHNYTLVDGNWDEAARVVADGVCDAVVRVHKYHQSPITISVRSANGTPILRETHFTTVSGAISMLADVMTHQTGGMTGSIKVPDSLSATDVIAIALGEAIRQVSLRSDARREDTAKLILKLLKRWKQHKEF
jgi:hypothetical protein